MSDPTNDPNRDWRPFEPCLENTRTTELRRSIEPREGRVFQTHNFDGTEMKILAEFAKKEIK